MKTPLAVVLTLMGTLLITKHPIADYLYQSYLVELMRRPTEGYFSKSCFYMPEPSNFYCWLAGVAMIVVAVVFSAKGRSPVTPQD